MKRKQRFMSTKHALTTSATGGNTLLSGTFLRSNVVPDLSGNGGNFGSIGSGTCAVGECEDGFSNGVSCC